MKRRKLGMVIAACRVAPRAGAWIETADPAVMPSPEHRSPPARGRGLKP